MQALCWGYIQDGSKILAPICLRHTPTVSSTGRVPAALFAVAYLTALRPLGPLPLNPVSTDLMMFKALRCWLLLAK